MKRGRLVSIVFALCAALTCGFFLGGCATQLDRAPAGLYRVAISADIPSMDTAHDTSDYWVPMNTFDRLFETRLVDGQTQMINSLCVDHSTSEDGTRYDFTLRDGVQFSNGDPLTSSDVCYTFTRLLTEGAVNTDIPLQIKGGQAVLDGKATTLEGFAIHDDTHFSITLEAPNAGFLAELSSPAVSIVNEETTRTAKHFGQDPAEAIGTGPYRVVEWEKNDHITFAYNERYWGEKPTVTKAELAVVPNAATRDLMFQNGELDVLNLNDLDPLIVERSYKTDYADSIIQNPIVGMRFLALNESNQYLSDLRVRKAVTMAVDVDDIIKNLLYGDAIPQYGIIPTGVWGFDESLQGYPHDVKAARDLLAEAGYKDGEVSFEISYSSEKDRLLIETICQQLAEAGIDARMQSYDNAAYIEKRMKGEVDAFVGTWLMDYNDPANIMEPFFGNAEVSKSRSLCYPNTEVMDRVAAAKYIVDDDERMAEYRALERKIVQEDCAWVPLFEGKRLFCISERVESLTPFWAGYEDHFLKDVVLKEGERG